LHAIKRLLQYLAVLATAVHTNHGPIAIKN
jgi:hypothetical protein